MAIPPSLQRELGIVEREMMLINAEIDAGIESRGNNPLLGLADYHSEKRYIEQEIKVFNAMDRTEQAVYQHLDALHSAVFEVGIFDRSTQTMTPRAWDKPNLMKSVPWLKHQNAQKEGGKDIYIRPHGEHSMSLVDDLTQQNLVKLAKDGFQPSAVIETSPGNFQAWLHHGETLEKDVSTLAAKRLAHEYSGDVKAADWRHFGRLAGFTNRKEKHQRPDGSFPFCRLVGARGQVYANAPQFVADAKKQIELRRAQAQQFSQRSYRIPILGREPLKTIDDFRRDLRYDNDGHRQDLAYAIYAQSKGIPDRDIARSIASRDLTKKGPPARQQNYIEQTIAKARELGGGGGLTRRLDHVIRERGFGL